ncbi:NAD(P)H-dependent oxidoreductase (plasmid) [Limosilactobacillus reuteri]|uniref:NAD(P)H-dependent oxidoreductase n=1 Tax=Limosilactobacillus reuteri TaxID=1598 RepID=UPI00223EFA86|nr:NAD(P)H-dependent oxidoreductase [Limosilactobacillus reuteri]UZM91175.1 NAD(P)H-dependent oxidoreductase [Limosilactobacillus reuteri]
MTFIRKNKYRYITILFLFKAGKTSDPNVKKYQKLLKEANRLIFPVWWNDTSAIIKGFIDKVMKKQFAYNVGATGVIGHLKNIQRVEVMTTSTSPTWYLKMFCGSAIKSVFINSTLKQLGMKHIKWLSFDNIDKSSAQRRKQYLESLVQKI